MSINIDRTWSKSTISDFLKPAHAGGLIRMLHFKKEIRNINFTHVMDAGCGGGQYSFFLAKLNPSADITAYDIKRLDDQNWLFPPTIVDLIEEDHICRLVAEVVEGIDIKEVVQQFKIGRKRKAYSTLKPKRRKKFGVKINCETASILLRSWTVCLRSSNLKRCL